MIYEHGNVNLQSALNHLVDIGTQDPNKLMQYAQNPPAFLGNQAGLLINMAADMVGRKRQEAQTMAPPAPTIKDQNMAKLAQSTQPGIGAINPMIAMQQQDMMQRAQPEQQPTPQMMAQGGLAELDTGHMFDDHNYAGGGIVAFSGVHGSEVEADNPDEATSWLGRNIGTPLKRWYEHEHAGMAADDAIDKYKLEKGVMPWTAQTKAERDAYDAGLKDLEDKAKIARGFKPSVDITPTPKQSETPVNTTADAEAQVKKDKSNQDALKKVTNDYLNGIQTSNKNQTASYDEAVKRITDIYKDDPYAKQLREDYEKDKADSWYDAAGAIGQALLGAKRGQEGVALQQGFANAAKGVSDLKKQKKELLLAEQKADHEAMLAGAKYGFESEQYKAALQAKYDIANIEGKYKLEYGNIASGARDRALNLAAMKNYSTAWDKWTKGEGAGHILNASLTPNGDKAHDAKIATSRQAIESARHRIMLENGVQNPASLEGSSSKIVDFKDIP